MKSFFFREILLVSYAERKARRIGFHPRATVLSGDNETGKSSILKSLFRTFGASPEGESPKWKAANVRSVVRFSVDGESFSFLRYGDRHAAFDARGNPLGTFGSVTTEVAPFLSTLFDFRLRLPNRQREFVDLPPAYFFLPFYMDQDGSWKQPWSAFKRLSQFAAWKSGVIEYHAGIRGKAYYEAQAAKLRAEVDLQKLAAKREGLSGVYTDLAEDFKEAQFNVNYDAYKGEIEQLLNECEKLRSHEEKFKVQLSRLRNRQDSLKAQLAITEHARAESEKDYEFTRAESDEIGCPTCGAVYDNSFKDRFLIAVDDDTCRELAIQIREELALVEKEIGAVRKSSDAAAAEIDRIGKLLAKKEGELELRDLILQDGRRELSRVMSRTLSEVEEQATRMKVQVYDNTQRMKKFDNPTRRKEVNAFYLDLMRQFTRELGIHTLPDGTLRRIDAPPESTGSEGARVLLAYKIAFLHVVRTFGECEGFPVVIDSPKQQDQDDRNSHLILSFLGRHLPEDSQLILGVVDPEGETFGGKTIGLTDKLQVLRDAEYESVGAEVRRLTDAVSGHS